MAKRKRIPVYSRASKHDIDYRLHQKRLELFKGRHADDKTERFKRLEALIQYEFSQLDLLS